MSTSSPQDPAGDIAARPQRRASGRLIRGAGSSSLGVLILGFALIVGGIMMRGMGWTQPDMFKGLGLDLAMTTVNIGVVLVFLTVIKGFFYVPLKEAIDTRNNSLETTFHEAESLKAQMTQMRSDYEARLAKTEAEAREQIQAQIKEVQALRQTLMAEATAKADDLLRKAEQDIEAERQRVMGEMRREVISISLRATEQLIGKNVDGESNRKLVQEFLDSAAVVS